MENPFLRFRGWLKNIDFKLKSKELAKDPIFWARFFAYAIPLAFLLYVLYINFLPFGYSKTFIINVGAEDDTKSGEFYLEPSAGLSEKKKDETTGETYRELSGIAYAVFKPKAVLKDAEITVSVEGENVSLIPTEIDFDPEEIQWDHMWDFSQGIPKGWRGNAFMFDEELTWNGEDTRLYLPYSRDKFEDGPFSVYVEWSPTDEENNSQQIVGHYNWEIWQNKETVDFRVGRMNNAQGPAYSIRYKFDPDLFFNEIHSALAVYNPSGVNGYIELYIDNNFAGRTYIGKDKIWKDYNSTHNLSLGWSPHNFNQNPFFSGAIYTLNFKAKNTITPLQTIKMKAFEDETLEQKILIGATDISRLKKIELNAVKQ